MSKLSPNIDNIELHIYGEHAKGDHKSPSLAMNLESKWSSNHTSTIFGWVREERGEQSSHPLIHFPWDQSSLYVEELLEQLKGVLQKLLLLSHNRSLN
jgi:hypothetical protein